MYIKYQAIRIYTQRRYLLCYETVETMEGDKNGGDSGEAVRCKVDVSQPIDEC
jgi:hypothetical protein